MGSGAAASRTLRRAVADCREEVVATVTTTGARFATIAAFQSTTMFCTMLAVSWDVSRSLRAALNDTWGCAFAASAGGGGTSAAAESGGGLDLHIPRWALLQACCNLQQDKAKVDARNLLTSW